MESETYQRLIQKTADQMEQIAIEVHNSLWEQGFEDEANSFFENIGNELFK